MKIYKLIPIAILILCAAALAGDDQAYVIGVEDQISISFWQEPDLSSEVRVRSDGMITLPVIGDIQAAGLTARQLSELIVDQMAFYNPGISQSTVIVTEPFGVHSFPHMFSFPGSIVKRGLGTRQ